MKGTGPLGTKDIGRVISGSYHSYSCVCSAFAFPPFPLSLTLAGLPIFLKLIARMAGTEVASNIVVTQMLASGLQTLFH